MGISASQAKFLAVTSRKVDLEYRMQQICNRRIKLANDLDKVADTYNKAISDRRLYASSGDTYERLTTANLLDLGYKVMDLETNTIVGDQYLPLTQLGAEDVTETGAINAVTALHSDLKMVEYYDTVTGTNIEAVGVYSADALKQISSNQATAGVLSSNYIIMDDMSLSGFNWQAIGGSSTESFTGNFNGNMHTISNLEITNNNTTTGDIYEGMFGHVVGNFDPTTGLSTTGIIQNVNLDYVDMDLNSGGKVGSLVAYNQGGSILNSNVTNLDVHFAGTANDEVGGLVGSSNGRIDKCSSSGTIDVDGTGMSDGVGGLLGVNNSINSIITLSSASVDIDINGPVQCIGAFMACDNKSGTIENSYVTGEVNVGSYAYDNAQDNGFTGHAKSNLVNCYRVYPEDGGTADFWNGTKTASGGRYFSRVTTHDAGAADTHSSTMVDTTWKAEEINGEKVWDFSNDPPLLNIEAVNTYWYDGQDPTPDELEEALRNGKYTLVKESDQYTQDSIRFGGVDYESYDWRTTSIVHDDLYDGNDYAAQTQYEAKVNEINTQDKKLELEQQKIDTEYKAITTEKDTIKKLIQKNSESSFKIFS